MYNGNLFGSVNIYIFLNVYNISNWEVHIMICEYKIIISIFFIISLFFLSWNVQANDTMDRPKLFSYNSYLQISYDTSSLNKELELEKTTTVPVTVTYKSNIPSDFMQFFPSRLRNLVLYSSMTSPQQTINLSILNMPSWADLSLSKDQISVDIPVEDNAIEEQITLSITPSELAPAQPYTITLTASCGTIGRVNGFSNEVDIIFKPEYNPNVNLIPSSDTSIKLSYENNTRISFDFQCKSNIFSRLFPVIIEAPENISVSFYPDYVDLNPGENGKFFIDIMANPSFKKNASLSLSVEMQNLIKEDESIRYETNKTVTYSLTPPDQSQNSSDINLNLILNIILLVIIIFFIVIGKLRKCW